jgi:hypothetical protein
MKFLIDVNASRTLGCQFKSELAKDALRYHGQDLEIGAIVIA